MKSIEILKNPVQEYAWGSFTAIGEILGQSTPSKSPQAELWMGAHPKAPSSLMIKGKQVLLPDVITKYPEEILGQASLKKFGPNLPFLFKILAAEKPLSIQVHPNADQASRGYANENEKQIPIHSEKRNYKDRNHKPECICAVTDFWVLNGFRRIPDMTDLFEKLAEGLFDHEISQLKRNKNSVGLKYFFQNLMTCGVEKKNDLVSAVVSNAGKENTADPERYWIIELNREYDNDIGVLSPIFLNLVRLKPGEAICLSSGVLHAYLKGVGIELMANSDNVIRGGLTRKHMDIDELLNIVRFEEMSVERVTPEPVSAMEIRYPCPAEEFMLSKIRLETTETYAGPKERSAEILICLEGEAKIQEDGTDKIVIRKGTSVFIPAAVDTYTIEGSAVLYKATVP